MKKYFYYLLVACITLACKKEATNTSTNTSTKSGVTDKDGNTYKTVTIGGQTWMAENLKASKYNDGTAIPKVTDNSAWLDITTGAWDYNNNDASNNTKYGKLYNWYVVSPETNGNKNVCPLGWHVPSDTEWSVVSDYLGGKSVAGGKMKEVGISSWKSPNKDANNISLFTGLPGGFKPGVANEGGNIGEAGFWWSSSEDEEFNDDACFRSLYYASGNLGKSTYSKQCGMSIRCLQD